MKGILYLIRLKHRQIEQLLDRRHGERRVLLDRERRKAVTGLRRYNNASTPARDHIPEFLREKRGSVKIDFENGFPRRLTWRNAGRMDETEDIANGRGALDEVLDRGT